MLPIDGAGMALLHEQTEADDNVLPFPAEEMDPHVAELRRRTVYLARLAAEPNVADTLKTAALEELGQRVVREYKLDRESRQKWEEKAKRAMAIARQERVARNTPWEDASNVKYPLLTTAALQFGARAYPAIVDGNRVVKCGVTGADPQGLKAGSADRVSEHMSYQLLSESDWESDVDTMLHQIPIIGCAFKKIYEDGSAEAGFADELVSAFDLVVSQTARSLRTVPRMTHVIQMYPHEIAERQRAGTMSRIDLGGEGSDPEDDQSPHMLLEQHRYADLDGDGVEEPWIVTVHEKTQHVLRIRACFDAGEIEASVEGGKILRVPRMRYFVKIPFIPDPEGGFYDLGFGHLLGDINDEIDTTVNQMNDAATMQNAGGGFIGGGIDLGKGKSQYRISPGSYRTVKASGNDLKANIVPFSHPGPSQTTLNLLELMIKAGKDVSGVQDIMVGDQQSQQTATTTLALIEQGMKVFSAIYKRIFRALKEEFRLIFEINRRSLDAQKYMSLLDMGAEIVQDYQGQWDITPVADPNNITDMQRLAKAKMALEEVRGGNPHVNPFEATKRAFEAARIERIEELLVPPPPADAPKPPSPEEQAAQVKIGAMQQEAQIKQQSAMMDLEAKGREMMLRLQAQQADFERKQAEADLKHETQVRALQLKSDELDQKWAALQIREREMKIRADQNEASEPNED